MISLLCRHWLVSNTHAHACASNGLVSLILSLILPLAAQMRRTVSFPASPARLRARTLVIPKVDPIGSGERGSVQQMGGAEVGAAIAPSYKGEGQGKTRPDSSRRPMGRSLIPEKNVVEERPLSLPPFCPSHIVSLSVSLLPALLPTITPYQGGRRGKFFLEADLRI